MSLSTQDELVQKFKSYEKGYEDFFGAIRGDILPYMDYPHAKEFLKDDVTQEQWDKERHQLTRENVLKEMLDYMPFAWEKANSQRGLSANRSINHFEAWLFLLGETKFLEKWNEIEYEYY